MRTDKKSAVGLAKKDKEVPNGGCAKRVDHSSRKVDVGRRCDQLRVLVGVVGLDFPVGKGAGSRTVVVVGEILSLND